MIRPLLLVLALLAGAGSAWAQEADPAVPSDAQSPEKPLRAVIELFTSQGCSSCPAADAVFKRYAEDGDVLALTYHVDYWDYIGWRDTLASPRNTERQRVYAARLGIGTVYTPQAIVNGAAEVLGSNREAIEAAIASTSTDFEARRVPLYSRHLGSTVIIEVGGAAPGSAAAPGKQVKEATIWLGIVQRRVSVDIKAGENAGKSLTYANVVKGLTPVGLWNGRAATVRLATGSVMTPESEKLIVLLQETETGLIIGATRLN